LEFERAEWARLRASTPLTLSESDLAELQGLNERVSLSEVEAIYLPLTRLLNLQVSATQALHRATDTFLGTQPNPLPYVIGVAGSVAVGKSTFARVLRALLAVRIRFLHEDLNDITNLTSAHKAPHLEIGLRESRSRHLAKLSFRRRRRREYAVEFCFAQRARLFSVDVFARLEAPNRIPRLVGTTWRNGPTATLKKQQLPNGSTTVGYVFSVKESAKGTYKFRVHKAATSTLAQGTSSTVTVKVT
jgi:hypothetical protein